MNLFILPSARNDLAAGFRFYEEQEQGLGTYFRIGTAGAKTARRQEIAGNGGWRSSKATPRGINCINPL
jgi:hypothetical protein